MVSKPLFRRGTVLVLACFLDLPPACPALCPDPRRPPPCPAERSPSLSRSSGSECKINAKWVDGGAFSSPSIASANRQRLGSSTLRMQSVQLTDWLKGALEEAFSNERFAAPPEGIRATARHILLPSEEACLEVSLALRSGSLSFERAAALYSLCPTKHDGGSLGSFHRGTMVPEFDSVVFDPSTPLRQPVGPIKTPFGYHIVVVDKRAGV